MLKRLMIFGFKKGLWSGFLFFVLLLGSYSIMANECYQRKIVGSNTAYYDRFGYSASISGDYAVVSAPWEDDGGNESGAAYVFRRDGSTWTQQVKLTAPDPAAYDFFGRSVSISGDYIAVGSYGDDDKGSSSGSVYVFKRDGSTWPMQAKLTASDGALGDYLGCSVSISGDYIVAGAYGDNDDGSGSGSAYVFKRDGVNWTQQTKLRAKDGAGDIQFGYSVSIFGDYVVVGAIKDYKWEATTNSGSAHVFKRDGVNWTHQVELAPNDGAAGDEFGCSVAISGDDLVVGARNHDDLGTASGSAYVFKRGGTNWSDSSKLTASDGASGDYFGCSVAISGDYLVAGSLYDKHAGETTGSAHVFKRSASDQWDSVMKLGATGTGWYNFGCAVGVSGDHALIGARSTNTYAGSAYSFDFKPLLNSTKPASSIAETSSVSGGNVLYTGITSINQRGVCWSTSSNPTVLDSKATVSGTIGEFNASLGNLTQNTTYHVRSFASNEAWRTYGNEISFTTLTDAPTGQVSDITFSDIKSDSLTFQWTASGTAAGCVVLAHAGGAVDSGPVDGVNYSNANAVFGSGDQIGTGNYVVYMGTGTSLTVTGLSPNIIYHFRIYEFSLNNAGSPNYNTATATSNPNSQITENPTLSVDTSGFTANFGEVKSGTHSVTGSISVSGTEIQGDVTIAAPSGFEVSTTSDSGFAASVVLAPGNEVVAATKVYIRFSPAAVQDYSENMTLSSKDSNTLTVAVSGKGIMLPTMKTDVPTNVKCVSATCGGAIISDANSDSIDVGLCWGTSENPTIDNYKLFIKTATGPTTFSGIITNLNYSTVYYVRSYATNNAGTAYGENMSFTTQTPTITVSLLGDLGKAVVGDVSDPRSYTVSGPAVTDPIIITAPTGFELSLTGPDSGFATTQTLIPVDEKVTSTTVFVRFKPTAIQVYSGDITHSSVNADDKDVAVSGTGVARRTLMVPEDYSTVNAAMVDVVNGDEILITGTHMENDIYVDKNVTIRGEGASSSVIQGAESLDVAFMRIFTIETGVTVLISDLTITCGKEYNYGGAVCNEGTLTLLRCRITNNYALFGGGVASNGTLSIEDCCIDGNTAIDGGGIFNESGQIKIENSTITGNNASYGGGLYIYEGAVGMDSCSLVNNSAVEVGGGVYSEVEVENEPALFLIKNTIIADNSALIFSDILGYVTSADYNLIGNLMEVPISGETENNIYDQNPLLMPLADNGGPVPTMGLKSESPALDAGSTDLETDGRGVTRPQGDNIDIGAFESRIFTLTFVASENGSISGETLQIVPESNDCSTVTAVPDSDYHFQNWTRDGVVYSAERILTVTSVTEDLTLTANFSKDTFNVVFVVDGPGSLEGETVQTMKYGEICSAVRAIADSDGSFIKWTGSNGEEYLNNSLIFGPVVGSVDFTAHFSSVKYVIKATSGEGGSIAESGDVSVAAGASVTFTMTPDIGYYLKNVLADEISVGAVPSYTFKEVDRDHAIHAEFAKVPAETFVITAASGEGGGISPEGTINVSPSGSAGFVIVPTEGYQIKDVLVDGESVGAVQTYIFSNVTANHSITVEFSKKGVPVYTITATANEGGTTSPTGSTSVAEGGNVTYTFTPNTGYRIKQILVDNVSVGAASSFDFKNVSSDHTIQAVFAENPDEHIIVTSQVNGMGGIISPLGSVPVAKGDDITFTVVPDSGWVISNVLVDGLSVGAVASYKFQNVTAQHSIAVSFTAVTHVITASSNEYGSILPSGVLTVNEGENQTFSFTANSGYALKDVKVDDVSVGAVDSYTFQNVKKAHKIHAEFTVPPAQSFTITATNSKGGIISPAGTVTVASEGSASFAISPDDGYQILNVVVDGVSQGAVTNYMFSNVTANHTINAEFSKKSVLVYSVVASAGEGGSISPSGTTSVVEGNDVTYTFTPQTGFQIKRVIVDNVSVGAASFFVFKNVRSNHTIQIEFIKNLDEIFSVTSKVDGRGGAISPLGTVPVTKGDDITFNLSPDSGWMIKDLLVDGVSVGAVSPYTFKNVDDLHTITASFKTITHVVTTTSSGLGSIVPSGEVTLNEGVNQTFQFVADAGHYLKNVTVDDVPVGAVGLYTIQNVRKDHKIHAEFAKLEIVYHKITASTNTGGAISPTGDVTVLDGKSVTFTIVPDNGYLIKDVTIDSSSIGAVDTHTFENVTTAHSIYAEFAAIPVGSHLVVASATSGGTITPTGQVTVINGENVTFSVMPDNEYVIKDVLVDDVSVGAVENYSIIGVIANHRVHAIFAPKTYQISVTVGDGGSAEPSGDISVESGKDQLLVFTPRSGWHVKEVSIDGVSFGPLAEYEFSNVRSDHTVEVVFGEGTKPLYVIKATSSNGGAVSPDGRISVAENDSATFIILPEYTKRIKDVEIDGVSVGAVNSYTFNEVVADHTLAAYFEDAESTPEGNCLFGIKMSDPSGGWLYPKSGKYHVRQGSVLTLEVVLGANHVFKGWKIFGEAEMPLLKSRKGEITINGDTEVLAIFEHVATNVLLTSYASPVVGGKTVPSGNVNVEAGEKQVLSAKSQNGFVFKEWVLLKGLGTIDSAKSTDTHFTAQTDAEIMAVFVDSNIKSSVALVSDGYGVLDPTGEVTVSSGDLLDIKASPAGGQYFLRWTSSDGVVILDPNSAETRAVIVGDSEITAWFSEDDEIVSLTIDDSDSGDPKTEYLVKGGQRILRAQIPANKAFDYWDYQRANTKASSRSDISPIDNIFSPIATLSAYEDLVVTARFAKNSMSLESCRMAELLVSLKSDRTKADQIRIKCFPCAPSTFDPENDSVTVVINGSDFVFQAGTFKRLGKKLIWRGVAITADGHPRLWIDMENQVWSFKGNKMNLSKLALSETLNVSIGWGGSENICRIVPRVEKRLSYSLKKGDKIEKLDIVGEERLELRISTLQLHMGMEKEKDNKLLIPKFFFAFPAEVETFDPLTQTVELRINNICIIAPPGSFTQAKSGRYVFNDIENKLSISLNPEKGKGSIVINYLERTGLEVKKDYLDINLRLGNYSSANRAYFGNERTVLKWGK